MIDFKLGKTGGGKSYLCVKDVVEFLGETDGIIVGNLSLNVGELNAVVRKRYPDAPGDICERVRTLTDQETRMFYLYRERGRDLRPVSKEQENRLEFPDFDGAAVGSRHTWYIIDEAHIYFDARAWANVGLTLNYWASQHRKFQTDVTFVTQFLDQVEKRLRLHATEFTECANFGYRQWAFWALPKVFRATTTYKAPPCPSEKTTHYKIDPEIAACYDTTAGVGVKGGRAPKERKRKGLPFWTLFPIGAAILAVIMYGPEEAVGFILDPKGKDKAAAKAAQEKRDSRSASNDHAAEFYAQKRAINEAPPPAQPSEKTDVGPVPEKPSIWPTGVISLGDRFVIQMSDGSRITERDTMHANLGKIERVELTFVDAGGKRYHVRPSEKASSAGAIGSKAPDVVVGDEVMKLGINGEYAGLSDKRADAKHSPEKNETRL